MKRFITTVLSLLVCWYVIDRVGALLMWQVNQHTHDMTSPKIRKIVGGVKDDVIIMGTSRCNSHYVSSIISDTIGFSVYNAGIDGSDNIFSQYIALCYLLKYHQPRLICLEVQNSFVEQETEKFSTTSFFAPYFGKNQQADSVFMDAGTYWLYRICHLYRYNSKAIPNITGLLVDRWENENHGYIPSPQPSFHPDCLRRWADEVVIDNQKIEYLQRFVSHCKTRGVKLIFVISPAYSIVDSKQYAVLRNIARQNHLTFLDYHTQGLYLDHPDYFRDDFHLWDKGSRLYSSIFASDLKAVLDN